MLRLGARMRVGVVFLQTLDGHVRVNLRRGKTGVSEQSLDAAKIGAVIEKMRGETVPQFVWAECDRN